MNELTEQQLEALRKYGFDLELQKRWQRDVADGRLCLENNAIEGDLLAPAPGSVHKLPGGNTKAHEELRRIGDEAIKRGQLGVVVLNGGMATRFGGVVKGTVPVLGEQRTFLGLCVEDVRYHRDRTKSSIPLFCMNSFATDDATRAHFAENADFDLADKDIEHFTQFVACRLTKKGKLFELEKHDDAKHSEPAASEGGSGIGGGSTDGGSNDSGLGSASPYGPGHGDFAKAFRDSGALQRFLAKGGRYLLVRNVDNLGARIDPLVLGHHIKSQCEMTVEVAPKWPDDVGGSPFHYQDRTQLIEQLRYPKDFDPNIVDVFNTNTFTFSAEALDRDFDLGWYFVEKQVEGRDAVQIEHLIGEMTAHLSTSFLQVRRNGRHTRFLPMKTPDDLQSALEEIAEMYDEDDDEPLDS
ncbi:MAG: UTP--glucose-1-phosphate uridylyltransferase [Planctomycetota bacterium]